MLWLVSGHRSFRRVLTGAGERVCGGNECVYCFRFYIYRPVEQRRCRRLARTRTGYNSPILYQHLPQPPIPQDRPGFSSSLKQSSHSAHATPTPISTPPPRTNRSRHPLQTSSNPPTTSPQTRAHSLLLSRSSHPPRSTHCMPSSRTPHSRFNSATASRLERSLLDASVVVCRVMCSESER